MSIPEFDLPFMIQSPENSPGTIAPGLVLLEPGSLALAAERQSAYALTCGALQPISTEYEFIEIAGVQILVRILANLALKEAANRQQSKMAQTEGKPQNPFLPYDPDLFVADITSTHLCLLNKFNVVDHHLLIVTRDFEAQTQALNGYDFLALAVCLAEVEGLAFYNGGQAAGASQPHKHLQLVPLPLAPVGEPIPIAPLVDAALAKAEFTQVPELPFRHQVARLDQSAPLPLVDRVLELHDRYRQLMAAVGLPCQGAVGEAQPGAYNLLVTRQWMMVVPRRQERAGPIAVNSLGFAGAMLVRDRAHLQQLRDYGPLMVLQQVGYPK